MQRILILGGGFGGLAAAHTLRALLPTGDEIVLVERRESFSLGLRKTWAITGLSPLSEGRRSYAHLGKRGIRWVQSEVAAIRPGDRSANVDGAWMEADALVVALGAQLHPGAIPGLAEHALNVYDTEWLERTSEAVAGFAGGRVAVGIFGAPYACPPAPFEMALLLDDLFRTRDVKAEIELFSPLPMSLPVLGQAGCSLIEGRLEERGIRFLPNHKAVSVQDGRVMFATGPRDYDLILAVPPHRLPPVIAESGLAGEAPWVRPDPASLETGFPGVFAIGDCTEVPLANGMSLPKAGVFAEAEAKVVAERIVARREGRPPQAKFSGEGFCFLEVGGGMAQLVQGEFLAAPAPRVRLTDPSPEHLEAKREFERERLATWFGG
jgi:sulfide:quinone oxidoreductase